VMIDLGTPKWKMMSWIKFTSCFEPMLARGLTLIHLVNLLTVTSEWVKHPGAFLNGSKRSRPHMTNGHVMGMVWSS
jgi:hypothetical protein